VSLRKEIRFKQNQEGVHPALTFYFRSGSLLNLSQIKLTIYTTMRRAAGDGYSMKDENEENKILQASLLSSSETKIQSQFASNGFI